MTKPYLDHRARYYDSASGRFLSADPERFRAGQNFYRYVSNRPLAFADPFGLWPVYSPGWGPIGNVFGRPLSDCVRTVLQQFFPRLDLGKIRLHSDRSVQPVFGALAMTQGDQIYYDPGSLDGSVGGLALLGHEIQHSVQYAQDGFPAFYWNYTEAYIDNLGNGMSGQQAYEHIPYEQQATATEQNIIQTLSVTYGNILSPVCQTVCK